MGIHRNTADKKIEKDRIFCLVTPKYKLNNTVLEYLLIPFSFLSLILPLYFCSGDDLKKHFIFCYKPPALNLSLYNKLLGGKVTYIHKPQEIKYLFFELMYQLTFDEAPEPWQHHWSNPEHSCKVRQCWTSATRRVKNLVSFLSQWTEGHNISYQFPFPL